ncbi:MAG: hypothetical protein ACOH2R_23200 [Pseudomonas sp.]
MSPGMTIAMLIAGWLAVAGAMLWGVLRISRRHHHSEIVEKPLTVNADHSVEVPHQGLRRQA